MLLAEAAIKTKTNCTLPSKSFSIKVSPIAFDILSSKLYSDPILAIVRELLTNAYDSHKAAGTLDKPIHLVIPNNLENNLIIRDFGTGLSKEDVLTLYTTFFESTKATTNDFTGCFGLGSKTPFAYTSSFTVISYFNGIKYSFIVTKKDGYPSIISVKEESTKEPNGLEINIPVQKDDKISFQQAIKQYLKHLPEILVDVEVPREQPIIKVDNIKCYDTSSTHSYNKLSIKQGQNIYDVNNIFKIRTESTNIFKEYPTLKLISCWFNIEIEVPIGTLGITPSREALSLESITDSFIKDLLTKADKLLQVHINEQIKCTNISNEALINIKNSILSHRYFSYLDNKIVYSLYFDYDTIEKCNFVNINYTENCIANLDKNKVENKISEGSTLLIMVPYQCGKTIKTKLHNIVQNYKLYSEYKYIKLLYLPKISMTNGILSTDRYNIPYMSYMRRLTNILWTINNSAEYNFNVNLISSTKLLRQYPNHKAIRKRNIKHTTEYTSTNIQVSELVFYNKLRSYYKDTTTVSTRVIPSSSLIDKMLQNNTALLTLTDFAKTPINNNELWCVAISCLADILNKDKDNIIDAFITKKAKEQGITLNLSNALYIKAIGKTRSKYFRDIKCVKFTLEELCDFVKTQKLTFITHGLSVDQKACLKIFDNTIQGYPNRIQDSIRNTHLYTKVQLLKQLNSKYSVPYSVTNRYTLSAMRKELIEERIQHLLKILMGESIPNISFIDIQTIIPNDVLYMFELIERYRSRRNIKILNMTRKGNINLLTFMLRRPKHVLF